MTAVQTCNELAPSATNSAASGQVPIPPMPLMGIFTRLAQAETICSAIGFTAGPQYPPCDDFPRTVGRGAKVSRSTLIRLLMVLIREMPWAPPFSAAAAILVMSEIFGVSLTITGVRA